VPAVAVARRIVAVAAEVRTLQDIAAVEDSLEEGILAEGTEADQTAGAVGDIVDVGGDQVVEGRAGHMADHKVHSEGNPGDAVGQVALAD
jgi:hypothetical protein